MTFSIITPSYNQGKYIRRTITSIMYQHHPEVQHIVIDGGSTDDTMAIVKEYPHLQWVSETDRGQAHAINKGFSRATGDIIAWLNSDDYYDEGALTAVGEYFQQHPECLVLSGDITYVDIDGRPIKKVTGDLLRYDALAVNPDLIRQPSMFWRRSVIERWGGLDETFHVALDYEFFLRIAKDVPFHYLPRNLSFFRVYPENKTSSFKKQQAKELLRVWNKHRIPFTMRHGRLLLRRYFDLESTAWYRAYVGIVYGQHDT